MILRVVAGIDIGKVRSCGKSGRAARCPERTFAFATPESIRPRKHDAVAALKVVRHPLPASFRQTVAVRCAKLQPVDALQLADRIPGSPGKTASGLRKHDALDDVTQAHVAMFGQGPEHLHAMTRDGIVAADRREVPATLLPWQNSHPICARRIRPFSCPEKPIRQRPNTCGQIPPATEGKALVHHVRQSRQDHRRHQ